MWQWLAKLIGRKPLPSDEEILALKGELQNLKLELEERDQLVDNLKKELERHRSDAAIQVSSAKEAFVEKLLSDAAMPVTQLHTQAHLLQAEGKPVQARDVLTVAKHLVHALEDYGLTLEGDVGQTVPFDPNHHDALSAATALKPGQLVTISFAGISYRGKLLRKAGVTEPEA